MYQSPVVRVFTTCMETCFDIPWQRQRLQKGTGSGVYLGDGLILTGAHVIQGATFIQVQKLSSPDKVIAELSSVCHDADLALIKVSDESFFTDLEPAKIGPLPQLKDAVEVVGFPTGGDQVSVTNGVVSRIEVSSYSYSWRQLLCATIDAAINPGNSGGPVFNRDGEVVGIAFQKHSQAENSGQMIPQPVIETFLKNARRGDEVVHIPSLGFSVQTLDNPNLRSRFQVPEGSSGVLITGVVYGGSTCGHLKPGDVLHQVDRYPISNMATILYLDQYRTRLSALLCEYSEGDSITLLRRRDGELSEVEVKLKRRVDLAPRGEGITNSYYIYGGLVFQPLTRKYLQTWKSARNAPQHLRYYGINLLRSEELQGAVVLSQVLADEVNVGYEGLHYHIISEVNGVSVLDLKHLVSLLDAAEGQVEIKTTDQQWVIMDADQVRERNPQILERYQVSADRFGIE